MFKKDLKGKREKKKKQIGTKFLSKLSCINFLKLDLK